MSLDPRKSKGLPFALISALAAAWVLGSFQAPLKSSRGPASVRKGGAPCATLTSTLDSITERTRIPFWRIADGNRPRTARGMAELQDFYGTPHLLFSDELARARRKPTRVEGRVWYDTFEQMELVQGTRTGNFRPEELPPARRYANDKGLDIQEVFRPYLPEFIARSEELTDFVRRIDIDEGNPAAGRDFNRLTNLMNGLRRDYSNGFFLKFKQGFASDGAFPSERLDFRNVHKDFRDNVLPLMRELERRGLTPDEIHWKLKGTPNYYEGMILDKFLRGEASTLYIEERLDIERGTAFRTDRGVKNREQEFRVITDEDGVVVSAQHRWDERRLYHPEYIQEAIEFVREAMKRLPPEQRFPAGWDVVRIWGTGWTLKKRTRVYDRMKALERNITEVGDLFPEINLMTAQQIAARRLGSTPTQDAFSAFTRAEGIAEQERLLQEIGRAHV